MISLAVIIVNYNAGDLLHRCLAALSEQTVPATRILVVDNGSSDGSLTQCKHDFPTIEYHELGANRGFAGANNLAVELTSDCEWVAMLNPDAFANPNWVAAFMRRTVEFPDIDIFASLMLCAGDPSIVDSAGDCYRTDGLAWSRKNGGAADQLSALPDEVIMASAGAAFYRRTAFIAVGGFCERFFCYYEDVDLGLRLRALGYRCLFIPDAIVHHVGSALTGKGSAFSIYHVHRNVVWTYFRNAPGRLLWYHLPSHLIANLVSIVVLARRGHLGTVLRAKWDALCGLPITLRERRELQQERKISPSEMSRLMLRGSTLRSLYRQLLRQIGLARD